MIAEKDFLLCAEEALERPHGTLRLAMGWEDIPGADSIRYLKFLMLLDERLQVAVTLEDFLETRTLAELLARVNEARA